MVACHFSVAHPLSQFLNIELQFSDCHKGEVHFLLPAWRPGRYELAPYADHIFRFKVFDEKQKELDWKKTGKNTWTVSNPKKQKLQLYYDYLAYKMDAGNSYVDNEQVYINFVNCVFYTKDTLHRLHDIKLNLPIDYQVACALGTDFQLQSESFYELADSPLIASAKLNIYHYYVGESQFHIAIMGACPIAKDTLIKDFRKFTEKQIDLMGESPTKDYTFLIQSLPYKHYHGVEHQNSTVLVLGPNSEETKEEYYNNLLGVASHELFHAWNVCRIRPKEMSPYDFSKATIFETGFVAEGFTTYYGDWFLKQSGVFNEEEYIKEVNILLQRHFLNPGRFESTLIESSRNLWVDGYKKTPPSKEVSIYVKGALSALIMDLHIQKESDGKSSLLDIIKKMYEQHCFQQGGYSKEDVYKLFSKTKGLSTLSKTLLESTEDLEPIFKDSFNQVGYEFFVKIHKSDFTSQTGIIVDQAIVTEIAPSSPAYDLIMAGDRIIKIDGQDWTDNFTLSGSKISLQIVRQGRSKNIDLEVDDTAYWSVPQIKSVESPSTAQQKAKKDWIGA